MSPEGRKLSGALALFALATLLVACQAKTPAASNASEGQGKSAALRAMEQVAIAAHRCWFASKDPDFAPYRMANELNSFSGQPRFLLVPARNYEGRPLLVVQARGNSSQVEVFGPIMGEALGGRVASDIERWRSGNNSCATSA